MSNLYKQNEVMIDSKVFIRNCPPVKLHSDLIQEPDHYYMASETLYHNDSYNELITQAKEEADKIIAKAKTEAEEIRENTARNSEIEFENARIAGYKEGLETGSRVVGQKINEALEELRSLTESFDAKMEDILKKNEQKLRILAIDIARKIIHTELDSNNETFLNLYKSAADEFSNQEWVKLMVSEHELEFATSHADILKSMVKGAKYIDITSIDKAPKGTCVVETPQGIANASVETQLLKVMNVFTNAEQLLQGEDD